MPFLSCAGAAQYYCLRREHTEDDPPASGSHAPKVPVVFINALGTDCRIWDGVWDEFERAGYEGACLRYDLRGQGMSALSSSGPTSCSPAQANAPCGANVGLATFVNDLSLILDTAQLGPAFICGLSLGGLIAQAFASIYPGRVKGLGLCATGMRLGTAELWNERIGRVRAHGLVPLADGLLARWFSSEYLRAEPVQTAGYRLLLERNHPEGYCAALETLRDSDLSIMAGRLSMPTLVLAGGEDVAATPATAAALAAAIPGAEYQCLPGAGHLLPVEQPRAVAAQLLSFLATLGSSFF
jgi:3-oxoadipate enol-lactonase